MLWPEIKEDQLFARYQAPSTEETNQGDGCFRATALASLEDQNAGDPNSETLDSITLPALGSTQDAFTLQLGAKSGMAVLSTSTTYLTVRQAAENRMTSWPIRQESQTPHRNALAAQARRVNIKLHGMQAEHL